MSYILDALRKADAQRARDPARGIHALPDTAAVAGGAGRKGRSGWAAASIAAAILVACAWLWLRAAPSVSPAPAQATAPPPPVVVRIAPATPPAPPANEVLPPPLPSEPAVTAVVKTAPLATPAARVAATAAPPLAAASAPERTYSLAELPADVQQALPKFSVTGGVYSENVAQRMLVVNGQVFNEGSEIATGVVLEQIRPRVALLKFRGVRISQPY